MEKENTGVICEKTANLETLEISFIYRIKNKEHKIEPLGTQNVIVCFGEQV